MMMVTVAAQAAVDCETVELPAGQSLSQYLLLYGAECVSNEKSKVEEGWKTKSGEPNAYKVIPAWTGIAERFAALPRVPGSELSAAFEILTTRAERALAAFKADVAANTAAQVAVYGYAAWKLPDSLGGPFPDPKELYFSATKALEGVVNIAGAADADCRESTTALCRSALAGGKALMLTWALAHDLSNRLSVPLVSSIGDQVASKRALWERYLYQSKPMLPLDHIATDWLDRRWKDSDQYPDGLRGPPDTQYFLFHPSVAVEHVASATDGQQLKPVLLVEVVGVNRWRSDQRWLDGPVLRLLSGASLALSYADRAGVKDLGLGITVTFENTYTFGIMRYGSSTGVLFSIDFAGLWRDKYKEKYESFRNGLKNELF